MTFCAETAVEAVELPRTPAPPAALLCAEEEEVESMGEGRAEEEVLLLPRGGLGRRAAAAAPMEPGADAAEEGAARAAAAASAAVVATLGFLGGERGRAELLLLALADMARGAWGGGRARARFPRCWSSRAVRGAGGGMPVSTPPLGPPGAAEAATAALAPEAVEARVRTGRGERCLPAAAAAAEAEAEAAGPARWPPAAAAEGAAEMLPWPTPDMSAGRMVLVSMETPLPEERRPEVSMELPETEAAPAAGPVRFMAEEPAAAAAKAACRPAVGGCAEGGPAWTEPAKWGGRSMCACWEAAWSRACRGAVAEEGPPPAAAGWPG